MFQRFLFFQFKKGGAFNAYTSIRFVSATKVAIAYKNTGSLVVASLTDVKDVKTYKNTSEHSQWETFAPLVVSIHQNDSLQVINSDLDSCVSYPQAKDTISRTSCLIANPNRLMAFTPNTLYIWDRKNLGAPPKEVPFKDNRNPKSRPIINPRGDWSHMLENNLFVLGNADVWQLWKLADNNSGMCKLIIIKNE